MRELLSCYCFDHHINFLGHILKRKIINYPGLCGVNFLTLLALLSLAVDCLKPAVFAFCSFLNLFFSTPVDTICQNHGRFHVLQEFDEGKRSCRRRLAGHNKRRRKTHPDASVVNDGSVNEEKGSSYLLMSLLRILSNMHCEFLCVQKFIYLSFFPTIIYVFWPLIVLLGLCILCMGQSLIIIIFFKKGGSLCR